MPTIHRESENFPGSTYTEPEWEFIRAMAKFQKQSGKRFPSWREVFAVLKSLGYRLPEQTSGMEIQP
ncbi:hypothetical protein BH11PLA2_BH11PLA2_21680 [soil metagenome]